ncbi:hypothetical protein D3C87_1224220 [compost metagenome]
MPARPRRSVALRSTTQARCVVTRLCRLERVSILHAGLAVRPCAAQSVAVSAPRPRPGALLPADQIRNRREQTGHAADIQETPFPRRIVRRCPGTPTSARHPRRQVFHFRSEETLQHESHRTTPVVAGRRRARRVCLRHRRAVARGSRQCAVDRGCRALHLPDRLPLLQPLHRRQGDAARPQTHDARVAPQRRPGLRADQQGGAVRPPLRRHCRRRPAGGPGAGRADGLHARHAVDPGRRGVRRCGAGLHDPVHLHAPRRPLAGRSGQVRNGHGARHDRAVRLLHDHDHHPGGAGADRGEGAGRLAVGHLHRGGDHPHRAVHGHLHPLHPPGPHRRGLRHRLRAADAGHHRRPVRARERHAGAAVHLRRQGPDVDADHLRLHRRRAAGVAAAGAA